MLKNSFLIAWRVLIRQKLFSLINIFGLTIGMAAAFLILEYVQFEWSFDQFHPSGEQVYRVVNDRYQEGERVQIGTITYPMIGAALEREIPEITTHTRFSPFGRLGVRYKDQIYTETEGIFSDERFFELLDFPILAGDPKTAMKEPWNLAISETLARKYFGEQSDYRNILGEIFELQDNRSPAKIAVVYADMPENSHLQFDLLISYATFLQQAGEGADNSTSWSDFYHYVKVNPGTDMALLQLKLDEFGKRHFKSGEVSGSEERFFLQPLTEAHLYSEALEYEMGLTANGTSINALFLIALFILCIAWINYLNLATARALERAKEVGIRKVLGAVRTQLIRQFIIESFLFNVIGLICAITLVQFVQPLYNQWLGQNLSLNLLTQGDIISLILVCMLGLGFLLSGLYPAFVLSAYQPVVVLKGKFARTGKGAPLRKVLVIFQFACAVLFIAGTLTVYQQVNFMKQQSLGINIEQTLVLEGPYMASWDSSFIERVQTFKTEVKRIPEVLSATASQRLPGHRLGRSFDFRLASEGSESGQTVSRMPIDFEFAEVYGLQLVAGRLFRMGDHSVDWDQLNTILINESASSLLGFETPQASIGEQVLSGDKSWTIVGVVADFHQRSLQNPIEPIQFIPAYSTYDYYSLKISPDDLTATLAAVEATYTDIFPGNPFDYSFMDQNFEAQYVQEKRFGQLFGLFSFLTVVIACLGLLGLSAYSAFQRTKEIGIRKVLGASLPDLVFLLSREFLILIGIASLIIVPLSIWGINWWLEQFAYRMEVSTWLILIPILLVMLIAILTVAGHTLQTARANPIEALRNE